MKKCNAAYRFPNCDRIISTGVNCDLFGRPTTRFGKLSNFRRFVVGAAALLAATMVTPSTARAPFHLWQIDQVYTNSTGTLQFIELHCPTSGQNFVPGQQIQVTNGTQTNTFTIPSGSSDLPGNTNGQELLFATAGVHAAGGPVPDYIIPNNFLFAAGGTINFFGSNSGSYTALPTNGTLSRVWNGGNEVNTLTNYAGQSGTITAAVPEPTSLLLTSLTFSVLGVYWLRSRRRSAQYCSAGSANQ
jgi:hypothetical protein